MKGKITRADGAGGLKSHKLINDLFRKYFSNRYLDRLDDSALIGNIDGRLVFTTDSHVVKPIFFPGGDIGKLAVTGTINDLCVMGAKPLFLSCGFILEEGLDLDILEEVVKSISQEAEKNGVKIATGDTKVVGSGEADKLYINTSGIGIIYDGWDPDVNRIEPGDQILISGPVGDHEASILVSREEFEISAEIKSDCDSIKPIIEELYKNSIDIKFMRDPTRGGLATLLNEVVLNKEYGIKIYEEKVPIRDEVRGLCEPLGFDPLYMACEGRVVIFVSKKDAHKTLQVLRDSDSTSQPAIIGEVTDSNCGMVIMKTIVGTERILDMMSGVMLPRIC